MLCYSRLGKVGRLGNQLFQVAFITYFAQKYNIEYKLPNWAYAKYFNFDFNFSKNTEECKFDLVLKEPRLGYHEDFFKAYIEQMKYQNVNIITGYFQSYKYFTKKHALNIFQPNELFSPPKIDSASSVAISVRRGDFVNHPKYNSIEASCFKLLLGKFKEHKVYVFTDDFKYCRKHFIGNEFEFMEGLNDVEQLISMSKFRKFILSNSTFSYWGPMLNSDPLIVYYPKYMFPNIERCNLYNNEYWPNEPQRYSPYINPITKPFYTD